MNDFIFFDLSGSAPFSDGDLHRFIRSVILDLFIINGFDDPIFPATKGIAAFI